MTIIARMFNLMCPDALSGGFSRLCRLVSVLFLIALTVGCAATSTTILDEEVVSNQKHMATYKALIIHDFELKNELFTNSPTAGLNERERRYAEIPAALAENIERYVKARNTFPHVARNGKLSGTTLVLKGKFTRVSRFRISISGTLHDGGSDQEVAYFRQTLWDVFDTTEAINLLAREVADFIDRIQYK